MSKKKKSKIWILHTLWSISMHPWWGEVRLLKAQAPEFIQARLRRYHSSPLLSPHLSLVLCLLCLTSPLSCSSHSQMHMILSKLQSSLCCSLKQSMRELSFSFLYLKITPSHILIISLSFFFSGNIWEWWETHRGPLIGHRSVEGIFFHLFYPPYHPLSPFFIFSISLMTHIRVLVDWRRQYAEGQRMCGIVETVLVSSSHQHTYEISIQHLVSFSTTNTS